MKKGNKLLAVMGLAYAALGASAELPKTVDTEVKATPKQILPKKEWRRRKAKLRQQKHSRSKNRL